MAALEPPPEPPAAGLLPDEPEPLPLEPLPPEPLLPEPLSFDPDDEEVVVVGDPFEPLSFEVDEPDPPSLPEEEADSLAVVVLRESVR